MTRMKPPLAITSGGGGKTRPDQTDKHELVKFGSVLLVLCRSIIRRHAVNTAVALSRHTILFRVAIMDHREYEGLFRPRLSLNSWGK